MTKPTSDFLEILLNKDEGINIDFKEKIDINTDAGKAKFIKVFLALANSPIKPANIILGVENKPKEKGVSRKVAGVQEDVDEERLQNLIHAFCTPPIRFTYQQLEHPDGVVGFINIIGHRRPYTPKEKYLKLLTEKERQSISEKTVFIRHGSTTDTAHPEEIMEMERERNDLQEDISNELLNEISDISSSLSHIRWSLERMEKGSAKDNAIGYAATGIISGLFINFFYSLGWNVTFSIFLGLCIPTLVSIIFSALRINNPGLIRNAIIGLIIAVVFWLLSMLMDGLVLAQLGSAPSPMIPFLLWGSIKGLASSIPAILTASNLGFEDF